jgi:uncharacterized protein (DUF58 family)
VLARVRALQLRARAAAAGMSAGLRRSIRVGQAVEFADYKPYTPGDSLRDLDWRVLGRRDRLVVRRYRAETELGVTLVLDASADLASTPAKWEQALGLVATLAWVLFLENEPVGLHVVAGEGVAVPRLRARRGRGQLARVFGTLAAVRPGGRAGLHVALQEVGARAHPRGLVVLVGDFMEAPEVWGGALDALVQRRADLRAVQVYDRDEIGLAFAQPLRLYSPEGGADETLDPAAMRAGVREEARRFFGEVRAAMRRRRGVHVLAEAHAPLADLVANVLLGREAGEVP